MKCLPTTISNIYLSKYYVIVAQQCMYLKSTYIQFCLQKIDKRNPGSPLRGQIISELLLELWLKVGKPAMHMICRKAAYSLNEGKINLVPTLKHLL